MIGKIIGVFRIRFLKSNYQNLRETTSTSHKFCLLILPHFFQILKNVIYANSTQQLNISVNKYT